MVYNPPTWLPEEICVSPWSHNYTYNMLYDYFCIYIRGVCLRYGGFRVVIPKEKEDGKEKIFWHLTSRYQWVWDSTLKKKTRKRLPELARCSRISWINPIITHSYDQEVLAWDYLEGNKEIKTYLWLRNHHFVVIFKKFPDGNRLLITSFYVDIEHKKEEFDRKYRDRIQ